MLRFSTGEKNNTAETASRLRGMLDQRIESAEVSCRREDNDGSGNDSGSFLKRCKHERELYEALIQTMKES